MEDWVRGPATPHPTQGVETPAMPSPTRGEANTAARAPLTSICVCPIYSLYSYYVSSLPPLRHTQLPAAEPPARPAPSARRRHGERGAPPGRNHPADLCGDRAAHRRPARHHLEVVKNPQMDAALLRTAVDPHGSDLARGPHAPAPHARPPPRRARRAHCARARGGTR